MEAIDSAETIKAVHIAHWRAIRAGADPLVADIKRDEALERLQRSGSSIMTEAQEVMPRVFLGPFSVARDEAKLQELGITHVVCLSAEGKCELGSVTYLEHPLVEMDCTLQNGAEQIARLVPSCVSFVQSALASGDGKVIIHCLHGKTRSAAVASCVRAVLLGETFEEAYNRIRKERDVFVPVEWHKRFQKAVAHATRGRQIRRDDEIT